MAPTLLAGLVLAAASALGAGWAVARRRRMEQRVRLEMRRRLIATYPAAERAEAPVQLRAPTGWVAVGEDGIQLALGDLGAEGLRHVPWSAVRQVESTGRGAVSVHVSRVGEVHVPGALGRRLWERRVGARPAGGAA